MDTIQHVPSPERPLFLRPPPGYFRTRRVLKRLRRFQNIIRHKERWAPDMEIACPIEEIIPSDVPMPQRFDFLDREIHKMMHVVHWDINFIGVPTAVTHRHWDYAEQKDAEDHFELILDYFRLPRQRGPQQAYEAVMACLEQAIGVYEARLNQAKRELFNPVVWIAHLIRLPISVMERAGLVGHEKTADMVLGGYARFMKIMMVIIIAMLALRLGVKMPWKDLSDKIIGLIFK